MLLQVAVVVRGVAVQRELRSPVDPEVPVVGVQVVVLLALKRVVQAQLVREIMGALVLLLRLVLQITVLVEVVALVLLGLRERQPQVEMEASGQALIRLGALPLQQVKT